MPANQQNLNDTTPSAPAGKQNVKWQTDGNTPRNDSANVPSTGGAVVKTSSYPIQASDCGMLLVFEGSTNATFELPASVPFPQWDCFIENNAVTAGSPPVTPILTLTPLSGSPPAGANLDGSTASIILAPGQGVYIASDGTNYFTERGIGGSGVTSVALTMPAEFSVSGSPVTSSGTFGVTKATQPANEIYAGPTSGSAAAPTFRALVAADGPAMVGDSGSGGTAGLVPAPPAGSAAAGKYLKADGTFAVPPGTGGSGTVTSVALTVPGEFSVSGSPVTGAGTLAISKQNQNANLVYAGPSSGGAAAPTFRALVPADGPAMVGDSGSGGAAGLVPAPAAGTAAAGKYLRADGTFAVPPGTGGSAASGGMWQLSPPALGAFTWANQGSATTQAGTNFLSILSPSSGSTSIRLLYKAVPGSTPWDLFALILVSGTPSTDFNCGLVIYDGTKIITLSMQITRGGSSGFNLLVYEFNSVTSFNTTVASDNYSGATPLPIWLNIHNDGTNLKFYYSFDGVGTPGTSGGWRLLATVGVTAFLSAATYYGFYANSENSAPCSCTCLSFANSMTAN
jgi:hypothetical protein